MKNEYVEMDKVTPDGTFTTPSKDEYRHAGFAAVLQAK